MRSLNKFWFYIKKYWKVILFGLSILFVILGYLFMKKSKDNLAKSNLKKRSLELRREISELKGKREAVESGLIKIDSDLEVIDSNIASKKAELKKVDSKYKNLKLKDLVDKYDDLGY